MFEIRRSKERKRGGGGEGRERGRERKFYILELRLFLEFLNLIFILEFSIFYRRNFLIFCLCGIMYCYF